MPREGWSARTPVYMPTEFCTDAYVGFHPVRLRLHWVPDGCLFVPCVDMSFISYPDMFRIKCRTVVGNGQRHADSRRLEDILEGLDYGMLDRMYRLANAYHRELCEAGIEHVRGGYACEGLDVATLEGIGERARRSME